MEKRMNEGIKNKRQFLEAVRARYRNLFTNRRIMGLVGNR